MSRARERTIFVTSFKRPITEDNLREHFAQFGEIESFTWALTKITKRSRGFAHITYKSEDDVENVLRQPHVLGGRHLVVQKSRPILHQFEKTCFVQVRNVDSKVKKEDLKEHFSKYGSVVAIDWPVDVKTNSKHDFCFVQFSSTDEAELASRDINQTLFDQDVQVQKSNSKICTNLAATNRLVVSANATVEAVVAYFGKFGKIKSAWGNYSIVGTDFPLYPMYSLLFEEEKSVHEISKQTHFIQGQEVFPSRGLPKSALAYPFEKKVFVDELPMKVTKDDVTRYFRQFGQVQHVYFTEEPGSGKTLNCVVTLMTVQDVNKVMVEEKHWLNEKEIRVRRFGYRNVDNATINIINATSSTNAD